MNSVKRDFKLIFWEQIDRLLYQFNPITEQWQDLLADDTIISPKGIYAAIGSRDLQEDAKDYIRDLYNDSL